MKLCGNCVFSQNFLTRKLGEILIFYAVVLSKFAGRKLAIFGKQGWIIYWEFSKEQFPGKTWESCFGRFNRMFIYIYIF